MGEAPVEEQVVVNIGVTQRGGLGLLRQVILSLDLLCEYRKLACERVLLIATKIGRNKSLNSGADGGINESALGATYGRGPKCRDDGVNTIKR